MDINQRVTKFRQKCINKLSRRDAEFFYDNGTIKDLSLFCSLVKLKKLSFNDDFELEMMLVRYLQILMILSSVSEDKRDEQLVEKFMPVPFECEEIVKMRPPYKNPDNIDLIFQLIKKRYPLHEYWDVGARDTDMIQAATDKKSVSLMDDILSYYSTPIVGIISVLGIKPKDFNFFQELKELLQFELQRHGQAYKGKRKEENQYKKVMYWVVKFNLNKAA
jgi:hypothetical protein